MMKFKDFVNKIQNHGKMILKVFFIRKEILFVWDNLMQLQKYKFIP